MQVEDAIVVALGQHRRPSIVRQFTSGLLFLLYFFSMPVDIKVVRLQISALSFVLYNSFSYFLAKYVLREINEICYMPISIIIYDTHLMTSFEFAHLLYSRLGPPMLIMFLKHPDPFAYLHRCSSKYCCTDTVILHDSGHLMKV